MGHTCAPRPCGRAVAAGRQQAGRARRSSHGRCVAGKQPAGGGGAAPRRGDSAACGAIAYPPHGDSTAARLLSPAPHGAQTASEVPPLVLRGPRPAKMPHLDAPPATHELLSGSARLLVGTDGSLVLFRADKPDQPSVQGRAVLPWFLARQGAVATRADGDEGSESLELRWGNSAVLRVTPVGEESLSQGGPWTLGLSDGFVVQFMVRPGGGEEGRAGVSQAQLTFDLAPSGHWYGGGHLMRQHWPLNDGSWDVGPHYPFDNGPNGLNTLVGHHWVTSCGALVMTDPDTPYLHVGMNAAPPGRTWLGGEFQKLAWGVGIQNFTRQILPLPAAERPGDGLLRLQARETYQTSRIEHPLGKWTAPRGAGAAGDVLLQQGAPASAMREHLHHGVTVAAAPLMHVSGSGAAVDAAPVVVAAAEERQSPWEGDAMCGPSTAEGHAASALYGFAHARDAGVAASFAASGVHLPLAAQPPGPCVGGNDAHAVTAVAGEGEDGLGGDKWLTLSAALCAAPDVKAATQLALRTLQRPPHPPGEDMLRAPIWTTWARYKAGVTQACVEKLAAEVASRGLPRSVLEIDDRWQAAYGDTVFDPEKFPDPAGMVARLHEAGFKVTCWVMPFVEESSACYAEGAARGFFVKSTTSGGLGLKPGFFRWWNSSPVVALDVTNPAACAWFVARLRKLQADTGVDGFKFDAGEPCFLPAGSFTTHVPLSHPSQYTRCWVHRVASQFTLAEVRTGHGTQSVPLLTRMGDRFSEWGIDNGLGSLIPTLLTSSVLGYPFTLPDIIGGNAYFGRSPSVELMVRWAQASALMPAMQFSIAPWDLSHDAEALVAASLDVRQPMIETICRLVARAAETGEPVCCPMWWLDPLDADTFRIGDQFALGDDCIVAPVWTKGATRRDVYLTAGTWAEHTAPGNLHTGPTWLRDFPAPLDTLPVFHRVRA